MKQLAIFVSGSGTNCENLIHHFASSDVARVALVLSNRSDALALSRAERLGVPTAVVTRSQFTPERVLPLLQEHNVDFIVLAGFLLVVPGWLIEAYHRRMVNLHPALLPKFGGKGMWGHHVHQAVKDAGETETGMTVHWVTEEVDGGEIIAQFSTPLLSTDTPQDIAAKEHLLEMVHFPQVVEQVVKQLP